VSRDLIEREDDFAKFPAAVPAKPLLFERRRRHRAALHWPDATVLTRRERDADMKPQDRIIVALDVPTADEALRLVDELGDLVSFYKVGLELLMSGGLGDLVQRLVKDKQVFVDLKLPDDISATVMNVVKVASNLGVRFLTLSHAVGPATMRAALSGRGHRTSPELLWVPFLSSQDPADFAEQTGRSPSEFRGEMVRRTRVAKGLGVDGFIVSGQEIALLRSEFPDTMLVSPGIRPAWSSADDHKRACTPGEAITLGANYIVIGRPIRNAGGAQARRDAARRVIDEVAQAESASPAGASRAADTTALA
jgi:orotidine-5'-phosphate decarboxylase